MIRVVALWRHPIKSHGRERIEKVELVAGQTMPWDRHWAVTHERTKFDGSWVSCANFMIGVRTPALAGIWAELDDAAGRLTLRHDDLGEIGFDPETEADRFLAWVAPLCAGESFQPTGLVTAPVGLTDSNYPTVSIMTEASHRAVADRLGRPLEMERWRGNIWLEGTAPWEEFEWVGHDVQIGDALLHVEEPIQRCKHTMANPRTGLRDTDTLAVLREGWDHENFGVNATVTKGGRVAMGDAVKVI
ncbi:MOSC domain-containing protein [Yoonia sp. 2307UL14-13]|uniref:MOSC domain-containing protein n=1 Tax=Yoonia sp. 2307UL14-13 TaxID=3126506 RepID=UPI0030A9CC0E